MNQAYNLGMDDPFHQQGMASGVNRRNSGLTGIIMKLGLATDYRGAQKVLLVVSVVAIVLTLIVLIFGSGNSYKATEEIDVEATLS